MRSASRQARGGRFVGRGSSSAGYLNGQFLQGLMIAVMSSGLLWFVSVYANGLRDPRYLDGWILAGGMGIQICFHIAQKTLRLAPKSALRWRKFHIFMGFLLMAVFVIHTDFSLPDTGVEWALWSGFVLVSLSGVFGVYITWSLDTKRRIDDNIGYDRIPARRSELAQMVRDIVDDTDPTDDAIALPGLPHDSWIKDLYADHLRYFFRGQQNYVAHLVGSQQPLTRLTDEIDALSQYVDQRGQEKLAAIKDMVLEKDRLDFARVYLGLSRGWLFVHGPVTYTLLILIVLHVVVVYSFSSGAW